MGAAHLRQLPGFLSFNTGVMFFIGLAASLASVEAGAVFAADRGARGPLAESRHPDGGAPGDVGGQRALRNVGLSSRAGPERSETGL